jgi:CRP-like cAMP-binding protein
VLNPEKYDVFLSQGSWFGRLAPSLRRTLLEPSTLVVLATGEELYAKGDACDGLYALIGGEILLGNLRHEPPEWFGFHEVLTKAPRQSSAMARVQSRLVHIAQPVLDLLLANSPRVLEAVRDLAGIATLNPHVPRITAPRRQPALISASP